MDAPPPPIAHKGRGALTNATGRFEAWARDAFDDGWGDGDPAPARPATEIRAEAACTIITRNDSPDLSFDRTINTYRGCEHGCVYCYARPNHAYAGLSPGLDFETKIFFKADAANLLRAELSKPSYRCATIVMGGVTDVYQPAERSQRLTRAVLEVLWETRHPVAIVTKSALVLRDLDLLAPMAAAGLAKVAISLTTLNPKIARTLEPRAAAPRRRLEAMAGLSAVGVPVCVMTAPMIPALNDHEVESLLEAAAEAGAREAGYVLLRLPREVEGLFQEWLSAHVPDRARRVMSLLRSMRGGAAYDARFGQRMIGAGPYARLLGERFRKACARLGLNARKASLDAGQFRRPGAEPDLFAQGVAQSPPRS